MQEDPTTSGAGDAPDRTTEQPRADDEPRAVGPPFSGEYRWSGPSRSAYAGAGTHPSGTPDSPYQTTEPDQVPQPPYGTPQSPYGTPQSPYGTPQPPYGIPQSPYGRPQAAPPYSWPYVPPPPPRPPLSPEERRRRTRRALALALALVVAVGAGIGIGAAIAPASPATLATTLVGRAIAAATNARTYHYIEVSSVFGEPDDIEGDAAPSSGQQLIRQQCSPVRADTTDRTSIFDLRLVHGVVYFRGNVVAVVDELGVAESRAASVARRWVKLVKGDKPYVTLEGGITTRSNASQLRKAIVPSSSRAIPGSEPPSTEVVGAALFTKKVDQARGTAVLVMDTSTGRPRTLRGSALLEDTARYTVTWTFSRYREKVHVAAPSHAVPYSSLHAKEPAKTICA